MSKGVWALLTCMPILAASLKIPTTPQPVWTAPVGVHPMYRERAPIFQNGRLYFIAHNDFRNRIYAVDAKTGGVLWKSELRAAEVEAHADQSLRAVTLDRYFIGVHIQTGQEFDRSDLLQETNLAVDNFHPLFFDGATILVGGTGELVALSAGMHGWKANPEWGNSDDLPPLLAYNGLILTGAGTIHREHGGLKAYHQNNGKLAWVAKSLKDATALRLHGDVALVYEGVWANPNTYVATVRAVNANTGKELWANGTIANPQPPYYKSAGLVEKSQSEGDLLILPSEGEKKEPYTYRVLDLHTGAVKSQFTLSSGGFTIYQGVVYSVEGNRAIAVDPSSGKVLWRSSPFAGQPSVPIGREGFVVSGDRQKLSGWAIP